jgi:hypothetical protein
MFAKGLSAAVVGVGALGTQVCKLLGEQCASEVKAIDPDVVEISNLHTTPLYSVRDAGRRKTDVVKDFLAEHSPQTICRSLPLELADVGFAQFCNVALIFSCVDSDEARLDISYLARSLCIPVCDAGLPARRDGRARVSFFAANLHSACYSCLLAPSYRSRLLQAAHGSAQGCWAAVDRGGSASMVELCEDVAKEQVRVGLMQTGNPASGRSFSRTLAFKGADWMSIENTTSVACPLHEPLLPRFSLEQTDETPADLLSRTGARSVILDWPICVKARCTLCGIDCQPRCRMANFWRKTKCPSCLEGTLTPTTVLHEIERTSPWCQLSFTELGLPSNHALMVSQGA